MPKADEPTPHASSAKPIHAVIDRIEDGGIAVVVAGDDEKTKMEIPVSLLPEGASDGDHLRISIALDKTSRAAAESRTRSLQDQLTQASGTSPDQKDFKL